MKPATRPSGARGFAALALAAITVACGSSFDPSTALDGEWAAPVHVPGSGLEFMVIDDGGQLSGTGELRIEAGPTLSFTVAGTQTGNDILLHFTYDGGQVDDFSGRLTTPTRLAGVLHHWGGDGSQTTFERSAP
jgi:hypothetical protein